MKLLDNRVQESMVEDRVEGCVTGAGDVTDESDYCA